jgi:alpha-galactosidase
MATVNEDRAHFVMWAMLAAPLIAGNDIRRMTNATRDILTNPEVIAIDQDALGIQGFPFKKEEGLEIWAKPLAHNAWALTVLNRSDKPKQLTLDWAKERIEDAQAHRNVDFTAETYKIRDVVRREDLGMTRKPMQITVPPHDVAAFRLVPQ